MNIFIHISTIFIILKCIQIPFGKFESGLYFQFVYNHNPKKNPMNQTGIYAFIKYQQKLKAYDSKYGFLKILNF